MKGKRRWKAAFWALAVLGISIAAGYVSNGMSISSCQQQVASWLFNEPLGRQAFFLDQRDSMGVRGAFDSAGARYTLLDFSSEDWRTWPRLSMKTHALIPFLISVDYFWEREAEIGGGGSRWFLSLFGNAVEIGETDRYST